MKSDDSPARKIKELSTSYWQSQVLFTALQLDLFKKIGDRIVPADLLAREVAADPDALDRVLTCLVGLELLERTGQGYAVREPFKPYLTQEGGKDFSGAIAHMDHLQTTWQRLTESVRSGGPVDFGEEPSESEGAAKTERFMAAMESIASTVADEAAQRYPLKGSESILDIGCGPGTYFRSFLRTYPGVRATAVDTDDVIPITRRHVEAEKMTGRVTFLTGDFFEVPLQGASHDVAILSNIIHMLPADRIVTLCTRILAALRKGGVLMVNDFFTDETGTNPLWGSLFSLNMLMNTEGGRNYRLEEGKRLMEQAGFVKVRAIPLTLHSTLLVGEKP